MAIVTPRWFEHDSLKWQPSDRNLFVVHKTSYDLDKNGDNFVDQIIEEMEDKLQWLKDNGIGFNSLRVIGEKDLAPWQLRVAVLVDLPTELRTMYALRFTQ